MTTPDWKELEQLWQSDAPAAALALEVIAKQRRRRWAWQSLLVFEIAATVAGTAFAVWWWVVFDAPHMRLLSAGLLLFTLFSAGASLWARALRRPPALEESVLAALDAALHRARVSVRWGLANFWNGVALWLFVALLGFALVAAPERPSDAFAVMLSFGICGAGYQAFSIVYYVRRVRELARLEELKRALGDTP